MHEELLRILNESPIPLTTRDVCGRLRVRRVSIKDHEAVRLLRELLVQGKVSHFYGKWGTSQSSNVGTAKPRQRIPPDPTPPPPIDPTPPADKGPWGTFRRLLEYYRKCLQSEGGSLAQAQVNQQNERFLFMRRTGTWGGQPDQPWSERIPIGAHISGFVQSLPGPNDEYGLVVGYPVYAIYSQKADEPATVTLKPLFHFPVQHALGYGCLKVWSDGPRFEVNYAWLEYFFKRSEDEKRNFLLACGFVDSAWKDERQDMGPTLPNLVASLCAFRSDLLREELRTEAVPDKPLPKVFRSGIFNRAVLMLASRAKFTVSLDKELAAIGKASDAELDFTALREVFRNEKAERREVDASLPHEAVVAETVELNPEQRRAVASLLTNNLTVVTGPPGTGKLLRA